MRKALPRPGIREFCEKPHVMRSLLIASLLLWLLLGHAAEPLFLDSPAGSERLLHTEAPGAYFKLQPHLESQQNLAFCGPASIAAVLNSLGVPRPEDPRRRPFAYFTQDNIFTSASEAVKRRDQVASRGMTLDEMANFLQALGVRARAYHADQLDLAGVRALVRDAMVSPGSRIIVNYDRRMLNQMGAGHQSPLGAYDPASDSVLILDVAKFKYPPTWISLADLLRAMDTLDPDSGKRRGLVVVESHIQP